MWRYHNPVRIHFGAGALDSLGALVKDRPYALVTYGEEPFRALRIEVERIAGKPAALIDNVAPNPDYRGLAASCSAWAATPRTPQTIVALGGGSVIDTAKVLAAAGGDFARVRRYIELGQGEDELAAVPMIAVPTTAGTGSDVTMWATVWDSEGGRKHSLARPTLYPEHSVIDPRLMLDLPRGLTVATGLDALSHALEGIWNRNANPVSTLYATAAARELLSTLPQVLARPADLDLRSRVARAALFAGLAFSNTKTAVAHSMSYPITLRHRVPHGIACSFTLPLIVRSVTGSSPNCDSALGEIFDYGLEQAADQLDDFLDDLGVSTSPADYGIEPAEWTRIVEAAADGERGQNFIGDRQRLFREALALGSAGTIATADQRRAQQGA